MALRHAFGSRALLRVVCAVLIAFNASGMARAADDASDARAVVQSQIDALKRNDAEAAYGFASPLIHEMFPSAGIFMGMVQNAYPPVYRNKQFEIGPVTTDANGKMTLRAGIVDDDDVAWEAVYSFERQDDGSLKISGCVLRKVGTAV